MKRVPHKEYNWTVGSWPHHVNPAKPCWPWYPGYDRGETEPEDAGQRRPGLLRRLWNFAASAR